MTEQVMIPYFLRKIDNFFIVKSFQSRDPIGVIILVSLLFLATSPQGICGHIFQVSNHVKIKFWRASKGKKVCRKFQIRRPHRKHYVAAIGVRIFQVMLVRGVDGSVWFLNLIVRKIFRTEPNKTRTNRFGSVLFFGFWFLIFGFFFSKLRENRLQRIEGGNRGASLRSLQLPPSE